jgi:hypothetical protein
VTDPLALEVRRQAAELAEMREALDFALRRLLEADDRRTGSALVPLLGDLFAGRAFTAADVAAQALNGRDAASQAVRALVADYCTERGGVRALGRFLARLEGRSFAGARLVLDGDARGGQRWRVRVSAG